MRKLRLGNGWIANVSISGPERAVDVTMTDNDTGGRYRSTAPGAVSPDQFPSSVRWPRWRVVRERTRREHAEGEVLALLAFDADDPKVAP